MSHDVQPPAQRLTVTYDGTHPACARPTGETGQTVPRIAEFRIFEHDTHQSELEVVSASHDENGRSALCILRPPDPGEYAMGQVYVRSWRYRVSNFEMEAELIGPGTCLSEEGRHRDELRRLQEENRTLQMRLDTVTRTLASVLDDLEDRK
jgi:hypothetical protein